MADRKLIVKIIGDASSVQRSFNTASRSTRQFSRDLSHAERGVLSGSGVFKSLGRSLAFASGGFLAFGSAAAFLRKSIDAAKDAQVVQRQLATQLSNSGKSFADYRDQIEQTTQRLSALSGFNNDELQGSLTTILRTVPNVNKALRDLGTAADLARAKHIGLNQAALIIAKTEADNTTLLRRQGFQIAKNAKVEEALATLRRTVAGQARAGTTEQERFGAVLHNTEEIIGTALLPTLNKYLISGTKWLEQLNESGKLQKNVALAAHDFAAGIHDVASVIKGVDRVTGSFKNTLELLLGLKLISTFTGWAGTMAHFATEEGRASREAQILRTRLALLPTTIAITVGIEVLLNKKKVDKTVGDFLDKHHLGFLGGSKEAQIELPANVTVEQLDAMIAKLKEGAGSGNLMVVALQKLADRMDKARGSANQWGESVALAGVKAAHGLALASQAAADLADSTRPVFLTRTQQNQFFDNALSRLLRRGGLQDLQGQLAAISKAESLLKQRLAKTQDITRRLNLEDQILELASQAKDIRAQIVSQRLDKRQQAFSNVIDALQLGVTAAQATTKTGDDMTALLRLQAGLRSEINALGTTSELQSQLFDVAQQLKQARRAQITASEFFTLGFGPSGEDRVPLAANLRKRLGTLSEAVKGTFLDTGKTRRELASIRKVLSESIVPTDVRAKIKELLDGLRDELNQGVQGNLTKFRHASSDALLAGLGLAPDQLRVLRQRLSQVGAGGTVPGSRSTAFSAAGAGGMVFTGPVHVHGVQNVKDLEAQLQKRRKRRSGSRRGPYAGRN